MKLPRINSRLHLKASSFRATLLFILRLQIYFSNLFMRFYFMQKPLNSLPSASKKALSFPLVDAGSTHHPLNYRVVYSWINRLFVLQSWKRARLSHRRFRASSTWNWFSVLSTVTIFFRNTDWRSLILDLFKAEFNHNPYLRRLHSLM